MDPELFEEWMMTGLVTVLILFMAFIVWDLAKKSKAGKFGTLILFFALGLIAASQLNRLLVGRFTSEQVLRAATPFASLAALRTTHPVAVWLWTAAVDAHAMATTTTGPRAASARRDGA